MPTKPILQYRGGPERPLTLDGNKAIVKQSDGNLWANKTALTDYIDSLYVPPTSDTYLYVVCQCGTAYTYMLKADVPSSNVTCSCGRKIIEYSS